VNCIENIFAHGGDVRIVAGGCIGSSIDCRVREYDLQRKTTYYSNNNVTEILRSLYPYIKPLSIEGKSAYRGLSILIKSGAWNTKSIKQLAKAVMRVNVLNQIGKSDFIHSHIFTSVYDYLFVAKAYNVPIIVTFHGLPTRGGVQINNQRINNIIFKEVKIFLVNTKYAKRQLMSLGCPENKIEIIPQGIKVDDYPYVPKMMIKNRRTILLTVARLAYEKGHEYAIEAVKQLKESGYDVEYRIVGDGPLKDSIKSLIGVHKLEENIKLLGEIEREELKQQYRDAHIFILPSIEDVKGMHTETQGVVIQEAQASGKIVIAAKTGGIPECVDDGTSAFLVEPRNSKILAEKIRWIIENQDKWSKWQVAGRKWVEENYSLEKVGERICDVYRTMMHR